MVALRIGRALMIAVASIVVERPCERLVVTSARSVPESLLSTHVRRRVCVLSQGADTVDEVRRRWGVAGPADRRYRGQWRSGASLLRADRSVLLLRPIEHELIVIAIPWRRLSQGDTRRGLLIVGGSEFGLMQILCLVRFAARKFWSGVVLEFSSVNLAVRQAVQHVVILVQKQPATGSRAYKTRRVVFGAETNGRVSLTTVFEEASSPSTPLKMRRSADSHRPPPPFSSPTRLTQGPSMPVSVQSKFAQSVPFRA